ncbi:MAG: hypothetical protein JWM42_2936 [Burkholderia sp.]|nr:hypothetical protein [Burkholderia sp.]
MDADKYNRAVSLFCPTCGHDQFSHEGESSSNQVVTCARCGLQLTREELIDRNRENIHLNVKDIEKQVVGDLKAELTKAFRGSKFIKVK